MCPRRTGSHSSTLPHLPPCSSVFGCPRSNPLTACAAGFLFYKGVTGFNEEAKRQDRLDGYVGRDK